ncbi:MAG: hypothetical protein J0H82_25965 [Alphaproteobacteria bacterium]|nr:hypothetical protein [Alphaproteobacteria bacterium]
MTSATPAAAIEARLRAHWTTTGVFVGGNDTFKPPVDGQGRQQPYVRLMFPGAVSRQQGIGSPGRNNWREDGAFQVIVAVPTATGEATAREWCDQIAAIFRGQTFGGAVVCYGPHTPVPAAGPAGGYYRMTFGVPYAWQFLG